MRKLAAIIHVFLLLFLSAFYTCVHTAKALLLQIFELNAAYIDNWLSVMKNDTKFVIQAASQAQAASDYILQQANVEIAA